MPKMVLYAEETNKISLYKLCFPILSNKRACFILFFRFVLFCIDTGFRIVLSKTKWHCERLSAVLKRTKINKLHYLSVAQFTVMKQACYAKTFK